MMVSRFAQQYTTSERLGAISLQVFLTRIWLEVIRLTHELFLQELQDLLNSNMLKLLRPPR
eukprot:1512055-Amphidinium_carterae.1